MIYPLVLDLADDAIPVAVTCRVLGFSKQAFYQWKANPITARDYDDAHLINAALEVHHDDPEFGYRFIADELTTLHRHTVDDMRRGHRRPRRYSALTASPGWECSNNRW